VPARLVCFYYNLACLLETSPVKKGSANCLSNSCSPYMNIFHLETFQKTELRFVMAVEMTVAYLGPASLVILPMCK
jgi:hypothetical protein